VPQSIYIAEFTTWCGWKLKVAAVAVAIYLRTKIL